MRVKNSLGGGLTQTPPPECHHQYIKLYEKDHIAVYECIFCNHKKIVSSGGIESLDSLTDASVPSLRGREKI